MRLNAPSFAAAALAGLFALAASAVRAEDPSFDFSLSVGLNYETVEIAPDVRGSWPAGSVMRFYWRDVSGESGVKEDPLSVTSESINNRTAGRTLPIDGYIMSEDGAVTNAALHRLLVMGQVHDDDWMDEDAASFKGERSGTGVWSGQEMAVVSNDMIVVNTVEGATGVDPVMCTFGTVPKPRRGYTVTTMLRFDEPSSELADASGRPVGFTIAAPGEFETSADAKFYFLNGGEWQAVPQTVCNPTVTNLWELHIAVDSSNALARVSYCVRPGGAGPWTILGTGLAQDAGEASHAGVWGKGAVSGFKGNGFDTQLVQLNVTFDGQSLYPGCNFEETVVTGRVTASTVHETDRLKGVCTVTLKGSDGSVKAVDDFAFDVETGAFEFYLKATDLTAGCVYWAEVTFQTEGYANDDVARQGAVMGRPITNETWGTDWQWVHETARTFDRLDPGTGDWSGRDLAQTKDGWIVIDTDAVDDASAGQYVSFAPTNDLGSVATYIAKVRAAFDSSVFEPEDEEAVFGMTVGELSDGTLRFLCLSNQVWQTVPASVIVPVLGKDYAFTVYVEANIHRLNYTVLDDEGSELPLLSVDLDDLLSRAFTRVDFAGRGSVTNLTACGYSTELVRIQVDFDDDTLYPGTNFEATVANGVVHFEPLWETDHTKGELRVTIRDKWGDVIGMRRISFSDLSDRGFDYYISGLTPGENYSVTVSADISGLEATDTTGREGIMARVVTNQEWTADGWIRENVDTFSGEILGTGDWSYPPGAAAAAGDYIEIKTAISTDESIKVAFTATNDLPEQTGYEIRSTMIFDNICQSAPTNITGRFGLTIVSAGTQSETGEDICQFLIISNGAWTAVSADIYEPESGVEYAVKVRVDEKTGNAHYFVRADSDPYEVLLACFPFDGVGSGVPKKGEYYGTGRVRSLEGDGYDVSVVKISVDFDDRLQEPGTNFASFVAGGVLHIRPVWLTDKTGGTYTVTVRDARGKEVYTKTFTYTELADQSFTVPVEGLDAGGVYDVEVTAKLGEDDVGSDAGLARMARALGTWIDEDADTFAGDRVGTGLWSGTNGTAYVYETGAGRVIRVSAADDENRVHYSPTNDDLSVRCSTLREVRMRLSFNAVGWYSSEEAPAVPENVRAAVTVWSDEDSGDVALAAVVATNDVYSWQVLENTRTSRDLAKPCDVNFLIDYKSGFVRYDLVADGCTNRVCQFDFTPIFREETKMTFAGDGYVWSIDGETWDPNLITTKTNEFFDLNEAIGNTGSDETLSPLWRANQTVTVGRGTFRVYDPNDWLVVNFPRWYYVVITPDGDHVKIYEFNESNNWIDYAKDGDENVETNGTLFLVKTPEGLSWIAALATNAWVSGQIELANDIDLSAHNWTPIAGFSGTFSGRGHTITNLNNSYHFPEAPGGEYLYGPTNAWGRSTYGLFGTATNATLRDVTFAGVAISNLADSVAALAGALAGNCAVSNVTVESGSIVGLGGTVAGLAGYADFADFLLAVNNTNRADIVADNLVYADPRYAAGILCVAGPTNASAPLGTVIVTNNVNAGDISGIIYDTVGLLGGNIAQILAGTTRGARFGTTHLTDNVADGTIDAFLVRAEDNILPMPTFPCVNLAPAIWGMDEEDVFYLALDGNEKDAVPVDPVRRTARMLTGTHWNGAVNETGALNDQITASDHGATITMTGSVSSWGPIALDRNITFDLGGYTLNTIWVHNPFVISTGAVVTVRNGTIIVGPPDEGDPVVAVFAGDTNHLTQTDLTIEEVDEDFYERTFVNLSRVAGEEDPISTLDWSRFATILNSSDCYIELYRKNSDVTVDVDEGTIRVDGRIVARLNDCYDFKVVKSVDGQDVGFEVKIIDALAPKLSDFNIPAESDGKVSVTVTNAKPGFYYAIQHKASLAAEWTLPPEADWVQATGTSVTPPEVSKDGSEGFYRVIATDKDPYATSEE